MILVDVCEGMGFSFPIKAVLFDVERFGKSLAIGWTYVKDIKGIYLNHVLK